MDEKSQAASDNAVNANTTQSQVNGDSANTPNGQVEHHPPKDEEKSGEDQPSKQGDQPAGGYDDTPLPSAAPGYTIKITFHRATNLPMADLNTLSSDPFVLAQLNTDLPNRHKEDPPMRMRTPTIRRNTNPVWEFEWVVANVPASGFTLKARVYDEDPADHDDRLGKVIINVDSLNENWPGIKNQGYKIKKKSGSKRAYAIRACAACVNKAKHMNGDLYLSIEMLGRTEGANGGKIYTVGPTWWIRHYSPMLGRIANRKEPDAPEGGESASQKSKRKAERYNFQANQMQLAGPVPKELYHRYVEFRPFVKGMFTGKGVRGFLLSKALHHQHARVYNFDRSTVWGHFNQGPCEEMTRAFLDLVHFDQGGRIFTYVLTLDSLWRFTETGKEFGIDMLSKHTMHSDVSVYIAFSGEFFIRRLKHKNRPPPPEPTDETSQDHPPNHEANPTHPAEEINGGMPNEESPRDPAFYELVIDNDSGTYRPNAKMLPILKKFLARNLPGLHIQTLDCQADAEKMEKMKQEQRNIKKKEGDHVVMAQGSRSSSISSSDEEDLDAVEAREAAVDRGTLGQLASDQKIKGKAQYEHWKANFGGSSSRADGDDEAAGGEGGKSAKDMVSAEGQQHPVGKTDV